MRFDVDPSYGGVDPDVQIVLDRFDEPKESLILEIGANQEYLASILTDAGRKVLGVDLLEFWRSDPSPNYHRLRGDFCELSREGVLPAGSFGCVISTSAIEHFGLKTYPGCPGDPDYDIKALAHVWRLLRPGGTVYLTVPYGRKHLVSGSDWRVYDRESLQARLIGEFRMEDKAFFKSAECQVESTHSENGVPIVSEEAADRFDVGPSPHLTVYLKLRRPS